MRGLVVLASLLGGCSGCFPRTGADCLRAGLCVANDTCELPGGCQCTPCPPDLAVARDLGAPDATHVDGASADMTCMGGFQAPSCCPYSCVEDQCCDIQHCPGVQEGDPCDPSTACTYQNSQGMGFCGSDRRYHFAPDASVPPDLRLALDASPVDASVSD